MGYKAIPVGERIYRFFEETHGCWEWQGYLDRDGYGQIWINDTQTNARAHRVVYEVLIGHIPKGMVLDHICEVRRCVNPSHLVVTTVRENTLRSVVAPSAINARKTHCKRNHEFTTVNTYLHRRGARVERHCRECSKLNERRYRGIRLNRKEVI